MIRLCLKVRVNLGSKFKAQTLHFIVNPTHFATYYLPTTHSSCFSLPSLTTSFSLHLFKQWYVYTSIICIYLDFAGSETVAREDIMEAMERAKFGISDKQLRSSKISKELSKLFPWMPSLMGKSERRQDDLQGPLGYQSLSSWICLLNLVIFFLNNLFISLLPFTRCSRIVSVEKGKYNSW